MIMINLSEITFNIKAIAKFIVKELSHIQYFTNKYIRILYLKNHPYKLATWK